MYEIFEQLLQKYGVTPYKVSKETGVSQSSLSDWKLGKITPKTSTLKKNRRLLWGNSRLPHDWRDILRQKRNHAYPPGRA